MDALLRRFNDDKATKEAFKEYLIGFISEEAVGLIFNRKDVAHIADAKDLIDKAFMQIETDYGIKEKPPTQTNNAR